MKTLVINLDRSADRLSHCHHQFSQLKLQFERVPAVDGRNLEPDDIAKIGLSEDWPKPTLSEFACFMSHRKCWELLVASDDKYAAIFEDDIILTARAGDFLKNADWVPAGVDLLRFETFKMKVYFKRWEQISVHDRHLKRMLSFQSGTGGYLISRDLAAQLLTLTRQYMPAPIDHFLFDPRCEVYAQNNIYQLVPAICAQEQVLTPETLLLGQNIEERSVVHMVQKKRGTLSRKQKIIRELKRGVSKVKRFATEKRMIIDVL
ncbi:glycosyltransferase family 25 protein [Ochrobactrum sp. GRS2]|nr:glycosyltransferase family 25 protein [Ochrobactrum sp. GRS2]